MRPLVYLYALVTGGTAGWLLLPDPAPAPVAIAAPVSAPAPDAPITADRPAAGCPSQLAATCLKCHAEPTAAAASPPCDVPAQR